MRKRKPDPHDLETRLGYVFRDPALLTEALTHTSATNAHQADYERLEFLGDRVLGLAVAAILIDAYPDAPAGELARRLNALVRYETCAEIATALDLGPHIRLGIGEMQSGVRRSDVVLGDCMEAVIGAVYRDGGHAPAHALVERLWRDRVSTTIEARRDPKSALQEWAQGRGLPLPVYREVARDGPDHAPRFVIRVEVPGHDGAAGEGRSKRLAEQAAAAALLNQLGVEADHD